MWLLGICSSELASEAWCDAAGLVIDNLAHPDLVVSLTAVSSLVGMLSSMLEESEVRFRLLLSNKDLLFSRNHSWPGAPSEGSWLVEDVSMLA